MGWSYDVIVTMPSGENRTLWLGGAIPSQAFFGIAPDGSPVISRNNKGLRLLFVVNEQARSVSLVPSAAEIPVVCNNAPVSLPVRLEEKNSIEVGDYHVALSPVAVRLAGTEPKAVASAPSSSMDSNPTIARPSGPISAPAPRPSAPVPTVTVAPAPQSEKVFRNWVIGGVVLVGAIVGGVIMTRPSAAATTSDPPSAPKGTPSKPSYEVSISPEDKAEFESGDKLYVTLKATSSEDSPVKFVGIEPKLPAKFQFAKADPKVNGNTTTVRLAGEFPDTEAKTVSLDATFKFDVRGKSFTKALNLHWKRKANAKPEVVRHVVAPVRHHVPKPEHREIPKPPPPKPTPPVHKDEPNPVG